MLMILPPLAARDHRPGDGLHREQRAGDIDGETACRSSARVMSTIGAMSKSAALLIRMSMPPACTSTVPTAASIEA
jgi:hypothetical protein